MTFTRPLPRFVVAKRLKSGAIAYYWNLPKFHRDLGCTIHKDHETALGTDYAAACGEDGKGGRAAVLNGLFDEWDKLRRGEPLENKIAPPGTVDWLFREYKGSDAWTRKVSARSGPDYERTIRLLCETKTNKGARVGSLNIASISAAAADKLYAKILDGPNGKRLRQAEKVITVAKRAWGAVRRLHPVYFNKDIPNPWEGVELVVRTKATKPAATRDDVYTFAWGAVERGYPEVGAAAVICFEWLQRPENVLAGYVKWTDYRSTSAPNMIEIEHHKTGARVKHPLEEVQDGKQVQFYAEAEEILAQVPKRGTPIVLRQYQDGTSKPWNGMRINKVVRRLRAELGMPATFTLDACRHGGMTELEEAGLTDGQGRTLSAHRSRAYDRYAKRTETRALGATRKRYAHKLANDSGTFIQNGAAQALQNGKTKNDSEVA